MENKQITQSFPEKIKLFLTDDLTEYFAQINAKKIGNQLGENFDIKNVQKNTAQSYASFPENWNIKDEARKITKMPLFKRTINTSLNPKERDGRIEEFNVEKIVNAARKAYHACESELSSNVENELRGLFNDKDTIGIEEIQDAVEKILMKDNPEFAKSFIIYRYKHKRIRDFVDSKLRFIENYKKSDNTANATIDDNSNVANHNIAVLNSEILFQMLSLPFNSATRYTMATLC
jgi:hypothetical protein